VTTLIFYEKTGCANNTQQKRLLRDAGHEVIARDLLAEPWTADRLLGFFVGLPVADWFNRAAPQLKSGEIDPESIDAATAIRLMLDNPLLIRRPLIEAKGWRQVGFDAAQIEARLGIASDRADANSLEACPRTQAATPCATPQNSAPQDGERAQIALAYHERTKHRPEHYAAGPETLDWTSQPDPFRRFQGSPLVRLPLAAGRLAGMHGGEDEATGAAFSLDSIGALLELSLGLSAWKEYGPDRWALRCNPSSGNLHPTEAYLIAHGVAGLDDGLYHYASRSHALEQRCHTPADSPPGLWIGLSSIHWREAWKYGERAFRYCQLDVGHALAALRYAAALLGWQVRLVAGCNKSRLEQLLGTGRDQDFGGAEREEPDLLVQLGVAPLPAVEPAPWDSHAIWNGQANILDPHPMYHWPVIDEVAAATASELGGAAPTPRRDDPPGTSAIHLPAPEVIMGRRSAQRFDPTFSMAADDFYRLVDSLLPRPQAPWDLWDDAPRIHPVFFIHRVEGIPAGIYILVRDVAAEAQLRAALSDEFEWQPVDGCPAHLPLFRLRAGLWHKVARAVSCQQAIAAESCFSLGMLAEFEAHVQKDAWRYRQLHWEAGLVGHVLYLEAETLGLRGTGIGCFLDDAFHELLGLRDRQFQSLYHFTVGRALTDTRITTLPPYPDRITDETEVTP
jgi:nitrogenase-associated protein